MISDEHLTFSEVSELGHREQLTQKVREFNDFFVSLCDATVKDEFGIEPKVFAIFQSVLNNDLSNYLTAGIRAFLLTQNYNDTDEIQDVPFFYPVIGVIRHNLLRNLCNNVINNQQ